jgi:NAD(P)-dependent dehydrogenase (short-subunit alcohol dehydrogenase family)
VTTEARTSEARSPWADVVVVDVDGSAARRTAADLPGRAVAVTADVSQEEDVERYLDTAVDAFGAVHLPHLNAGIAGTNAALPTWRRRTSTG